MRASLVWLHRWSGLVLALYIVLISLSIRFVIYEGSRQEFFRASNLFFHPGSGELLRADLYHERWSGDSVVHWIGAVHYGAFASWPGKIAWVLGSAGVSISALTGVWIVVTKRRRCRDPSRTELTTVVYAR